MDQPTNKRNSKYMSRFNPKRLKVSSKRQITIPSSFYKHLNLGEEVECYMREDKNEIVIRPLQSEADFSEEILKDLVEQGYSGDKLLKEFKRVKAKVRPAVNQMIKEAEAKARELENSGDEDIEETFSDLENEK